jgi:hypothetical protein
MWLHHEPKKVHEELFGFGIQNVHMQDILMIVEKLTHMAYTQPPSPRQNGNQRSFAAQRRTKFKIPQNRLL